jgi:hypothetical protein
MTVGVRSASADTIYLNNPNTAISGYAGPYGKIDITLTDSTHAHVVLTALPGTGTVQYMFGDGGTLGLNVNANSFTASNISGTNASNTFASWSLVGVGSGNEDGFGSFNLSINSFDGYDHAITSMTLDITNNSGTWANAAAVLAANNSGHVAAGHVFVSPSASMTNALATGYSGEAGGPPPVPAPSTLVLAFAGLGACAFVGMRRLSHLATIRLA